MEGQTGGTHRQNAGFPVLLGFACEITQVAMHAAVVERIGVADNQAGFRGIDTQVGHCRFNGIFQSAGCSDGEKTAQTNDVKK